MTGAGRIEPQPWMTAPETRAVLDALGAEGAEVRFVGGCVRDALAGRPVKDIDLATPDTPDTVMALLARAGLKMAPTGLGHGTVTAIARHRPFEVTTLRRDVETHGRHATVAFTDDWEADAARRDFTFNAMSCRPDGTLFDPFDGQSDLAAGRVRFVGDARARIEEDYLRLLRFFRFLAYYGHGAPDPQGLAAAAALAPELRRLSGERIREELLRLLGAPDPLPVLEIMRRHEILVGVLPEVGDNRVLAALLSEGIEAEAPDPLLRLAVLIDGPPEAVGSVARKLRLSNKQALRLTELSESVDGLDLAADERSIRRAIYRHGRQRVADLLRVEWAGRIAAGLGVEKAGARVRLSVADTWDSPRFPIQGRDVLGLGAEPGEAVGRLLSALETWWVDEDFRPDRGACLARLEVMLATQL